MTSWPWSARGSPTLPAMPTPPRSSCGWRCAARGSPGGSRWRSRTTAWAWTVPRRGARAWTTLPSAPAGTAVPSPSRAPTRVRAPCCPGRCRSPDGPAARPTAAHWSELLGPRPLCSGGCCPSVGRSPWRRLLPPPGSGPLYRLVGGSPWYRLPSPVQDGHTVLPAWSVRPSQHQKVRPDEGWEPRTRDGARGDEYRGAYLDIEYLDVKIPAKGHQ